VSVLVFERYPVSGESGGDFEALLAQVLDAIRMQPGLLWADGGRASDDGYMLLSEWRTAGDADAWQASAAAAAWEESTDPLLAGDPSRRRFAPGSG
jgi:heme-degrading monooxygenase HmoA